MAFKILDKEELELLNDQEMAQYQEELSLYQERTAFVEQIELLEQVIIEPYTPELKSIDVIDTIDFMSFHKPKYKLTVYDPTQKPEIKVNTFEKLEIQEPVLPALNKKLEIEVKQILKPIKINPHLPKTIQPYAEDIRFKKPEKVEYGFPLIPELSMNIFVEQMEFNHENRLKDMPNTHITTTSIKTVAMPVMDTLSLPEVFVSYTDRKEYQKPEQLNIKLPDTVCPNLNINTYQDVNLEKPYLPKLSAIGFDITPTFQKPELPQIESPAFEVPTIGIAYPDKSKKVKAKLPQVSGIKTKVKSFHIPEHTQPDIPTVSKVNISTKSFAKPVNKHPALPAMEELRIIEKDFAHMEKVQANVIEIDAPCAPAKTFFKPEAAISELPEGSTAQIPDIDKKITELMSVMNKEYHTLIG